jgi:predicted nucleotidyltransferase component of viral defense system
MTLSLIQERLNSYSPQTIEEEQDAIKEIAQEIILYGLSIANFFNSALFQGGTALRILHNLPRFSEDLDFILKEPNSLLNAAQ